SPNGWNDRELNIEFLKRVYDPHTREIANGRWKSLVFDNHETHIDYPALKWALKHRILPWSLPPKTSAVLQPLDVSCFQTYAQVYGEIVAAESRNGVALTKQDFARILPRARDAAFTRTNIVAGFERAGIYPYNPD
ncbi:hypothetical protein K435DRAFT_590383, partial [Dendrothele bispora CBS 962.96]